LRQPSQIGLRACYGTPDYGLQKLPQTLTGENSVRSLIGPKGLIVIGGVIGLATNGLTGLIVGLVAGYIIAVLTGIAFRIVMGGSVPPTVRREVITNVLANRPDAVRAAFPRLAGSALFKALDQEIEGVIRTAVTLSPSHEAILDKGVISAALRQRFLSEPDEARQR
jgi:hypothetical protein